MIRRILLSGAAVLAAALCTAAPASAMTDAPNLPKVYCSYQATPPTLTDKAVFPVRCDATGAVVTAPASGVVLTAVLPSSATQLTCHSGNQANADAVCTLAGASAKTTYITGFRCNAAGATGAALVGITVVGLLGGTQTYTFGYPAGATVMATAVAREFTLPVAASTTNTDIVVTLPAGGTGNTNAACNAEGFRL